MMLTRCPACQTVFRLRPEQLHARRGEVRCGHCFHPFNALEHALELPDGMPPAPPPPPDALSQRARGTPPAAPADGFTQSGAPEFAAPPTAPPPAAATTDFLILEDRPATGPMRSSTAAMLEFGIPELESSADTDAADGAAAQAEPAPPPAPREADATGAGIGPAARPATYAPATFAAPLSGHGETLAEDTDASPARAFPGVLRSGRRPPPSAEPLAARTEPPRPDAALEPASTPTVPASVGSLDETAPAPDPATAETAGPEPDLARLDATYGRPPKRVHPALGALGSLLVVALTTLLGAQTLYLYRMEIARELPGLRPLLTEACMQAGCTVPYPQDAERIAIEASDLQAEPGRPGHYLLHTTLNNRAEYPQQWPQLELTLTDAGDNPMSRRVLPPADWLPAGETGEAFPARKAIEVRLPFQVEGQAPTGYRIYAFYP